MKITLLGGGLGSPDTLTLGAWKALQNAQVLVGARRVLESLPKELTGEHGINVIGAALEGSGRKAPVHHDLQKGTGHGGFARAATRGGQHQTGNVIIHCLHLPAHTPD